MFKVKKQKGWKKTLDETYLAHFYNTKSGNKLRVESIFVNNQPNIWRVTVGKKLIFGQQGDILKDDLKSKSEALAYAKKYMGSH
jgi:hypothetical protein